MIKKTASTLHRNFGKVRHLARKEPVEITRLGKRAFVLMSAERYDWMRAAIHRSFRTEEWPETIIDAIRRAKVRPRHNRR